MGGQMAQDADRRARYLFTVGHSNHSLDAFVALLRQHAIEVLVDVRSQAHSRYSPQFDAPELKVSLPESVIRYLFLGRELGGRPDGEQYYDGEGHVRYDRIAETPLFHEGIARLERGVEQYRVAIMCSEENPTECHRRLLIGRVLGEKGVEVVHIRGDGRLQPEDELKAEERASSAEAMQLPLFGSEPAEEKPWRSTRSVSPKEPRRPSSEP